MGGKCRCFQVRGNSMGALVHSEGVDPSEATNSTNRKWLDARRCNRDAGRAMVIPLSFRGIFYRMPLAVTAAAGYQPEILQMLWRDVGVGRCDLDSRRSGRTR